MHNAKREPRRGSRLAAPGRLSTLAACALLALLTAAPARANTAEPMVPFFTLKETAEKLLPGAENLTRRDIELSPDKRRELEKNQNWNSEEDAYVLYHQKNAEKKITRTLVLFPEASRQGTLVVAVALDNHGKVTGALVKEAQRPTVQWLLPLVRQGYMDRFTGQGQEMDLKSAARLKEDVPPISKTYALRIANAVKKSAQLFHVYFGRP